MFNAAKNNLNYIEIYKHLYVELVPRKVAKLINYTTYLRLFWIFKVSNCIV